MRRSVRFEFWIAVAALAAVLLVGTKLQVQPVHAQPAALRPTSLVEVTGTGAAVQLATSGYARWVQIVAPSGNSAVIRLGDSTASATKGLPIAAGGGYTFPFAFKNDLSQTQTQWDLSSIYVYIGSGDKVDVMYAQ